MGYSIADAISCAASVNVPFTIVNERRRLEPNIVFILTLMFTIFVTMLFYVVAPRVYSYHMCLNFRDNDDNCKMKILRKNCFRVKDFVIYCTGLHTVEYSK